MALEDYTTLDDMKRYLGGGFMTTTQFDTDISNAITAASRAIDSRTKRYFGKAEEPSARRFIAYDGLIIVDDIADPETITVSGTDSFVALPLNGIVSGVPGYPVTRLTSADFFRDEVYTVTAVWGWPEVPQLATEVCKMMTADIFLAKDTPHGVKGMDEFGVVRIRESRQIDQKIQLLARERVAFR